MILLIMGVTGVGKSTVAAALDAKLGWPFQEGDDLHPAANVAKMHAGMALTDADRAPWLAAVKAWIDARMAAGENGIITCSALKRAYRDQLVAGRPQVRVVYLRAGRALLEARLRKRTGHFMPASLLASQLATLEEPAPDEAAIVVTVTDDLAAMVAEIAGKAGSASC